MVCTLFLSTDSSGGDPPRRTKQTLGVYISSFIDQMEILEAYKEDKYCILCLSTFRYRSPAAYKEAVLCMLDHMETCCDPPHLVGHLPDPQRMFQGMDLMCSQYYGMYSMVRISCVTRYKKLFTHTESHASAVTLLESGE